MILKNLNLEKIIIKNIKNTKENIYLLKIKLIIMEETQILHKKNM